MLTRIEAGFGDDLRDALGDVLDREDAVTHQDLHIILLHSGQLRRKLEKDPVRPVLIHTEPAVAYRFELDS